MFSPAKDMQTTDGIPHFQPADGSQTCAGFITMPTTTDVETEDKTVMLPIIYANTGDVIYGRGNHLKVHPGNVYYRSLVDSLKEYYVAFTKDKKKLVSELIYESIKGQNPPGKFLAESHARLYTELDMADAVRKISQCFREKQPMIKATKSSMAKKKLNEGELQVKMEEMRNILKNMGNVHDRFRKAQLTTTFPQADATKKPSIPSITAVEKNTVHEWKSSPLLDGQDPAVIISLAVALPQRVHDDGLLGYEQFTPCLTHGEDNPSSSNARHPKKRHRSLLPDEDEIKHLSMSPKTRAMKNVDRTNAVDEETPHQEDYLAATPFGMPMRNKDNVRSVGFSSINRTLRTTPLLHHQDPSASFLSRKHGFSLVGDVQQQQQPNVYQNAQARSSKFTSTSNSKGSSDSLIEYYTKTTRLHQDHRKTSSLKHSPRSSSSTVMQRQSKSMDSEESKASSILDDECNIDERDMYLSRGLSEISIEAGSVLLSLSSTDQQQSARKVQDVPEFNRTVSFKDNLCTSLPKHYSKSMGIEETKDDTMDNDYAHDRDRGVFGRALSEISIEAGSLVLSISSSDLRQISTLDQRNNDAPSNPISDVVLFSRIGKEDESGLDSSNDALDLLMATSLRAKQKRDHGIFEREGSRMSIESVFNRGWSLKSWDGSFGSSDIRQELERGLSHMTM